MRAVDKTLVKLFILQLLAAAVLTAQPAPTLTPTPASLNFSWQIGTALPAAQTIAVRISAGTPNYTVSIIGVNALWLTATPDSGKMPASLSVRVNPTSLAVGTYTAAVAITVPGGTLPLNIPVSLVVSSPLPTLSVSALTASFSTTPGVPVSQTVQLSTSSGPIAFTAAGGATWLTVSPAVGIVLPGSPVTLTLTADASSLNPQPAPFTSKVTIVASGVPTANKTQSVAVALTVATVAPAIASIWPAGVQIGSPDTTITVRGSNFYTSTLVKVAGSATALKTTVLSPTIMQAVIPAALLTAAATLNVVVSNPAPGGDSPPSGFVVSASPIVQATVNVASYGGPGISPGELVTLFGASIGPATPAAMIVVNGFVATTSGSVTVNIDGQPAPIIYISQNQITVQVPYEVTQGVGKSIAIVNGAITATGSVDIVASAPGIFSVDGSGLGQAAALNYNSVTTAYSLNGQANPAHIGDTIVIYLTGEGDFATGIPARTGLIVPATLSPLPQVSPLPVIMVGGAPATLAYAGPVVGSILGLLQINLVIPTGSATGPAIPISASFGGTAAQTGITIAVHP